MKVTKAIEGYKAGGGRGRFLGKGAFEHPELRMEESGKMVGRDKPNRFWEKGASQKRNLAKNSKKEKIPGTRGGE